MKEQYDFCELHEHLLHVAARLLRPGGLLVFLFHTDDEKSEEENRFPEHPQLEFVRSSRDGLTRHRSRHLITMRKVDTVTLTTPADTNQEQQSMMEEEKKEP